MTLNYYIERHKNIPSSRRGFTIVELLIVIVVIGILAAISTVSYNGIRDRTNSTVVRNDLSNFGKALELHKVDHGSYVSGMFQLSGGIGQINVGNRAAYAQTPLTISNLTACFSLNGEEMAMAALSSANKFYYIYSGDGFTVKEKPNTEWHHDDNTAVLRCQEISPNLSPNSPDTGQPMNFNGYNSEDTVSGPWRSWTGAEQ